MCGKILRHFWPVCDNLYGRGGQKTPVFLPKISILDVQKVASFCVAGCRDFNPIGRLYVVKMYHFVLNKKVTPLDRFLLGQF